jgi:hypothetical protein
MTDDADGGEYKVGYAKPPKHTQFIKGQSGNPRGRQKGTRGLKTDLHAVLSSNFTILINGKPINGTKQLLMLDTLASRAAAGDVKASALIIPLILQIFGYEDRGGNRRQLSAQDMEILESLLAGAGHDGAGPGHEAAPAEIRRDSLGSGPSHDNGNG